VWTSPATPRWFKKTYFAAQNCPVRRHSKTNIKQVDVAGGVAGAAACFSTPRTTTTSLRQESSSCSSSSSCTSYGRNTNDGEVVDADLAAASSSSLFWPRTRTATTFATRSSAPFRARNRSAQRRFAPLVTVTSTGTWAASTWPRERTTEELRIGGRHCRCGRRQQQQPRIATNFACSAGRPPVASSSEQYYCPT
jgi:hypothetical protein